MPDITENSISKLLRDRRRIHHRNRLCPVPSPLVRVTQVYRSPTSFRYTILLISLIVEKYYKDIILTQKLAILLSPSPNHGFVKMMLQVTSGGL